MQWYKKALHVLPVVVEWHILKSFDCNVYFRLRNHLVGWPTLRFLLEVRMLKSFFDDRLLGDETNDLHYLIASETHQRLNLPDFLDAFTSD